MRRRFCANAIGEFPTIEATRHFYDSVEYQPILKLRLASTRSDVVLAQD